MITMSGGGVDVKPRLSRKQDKETSALRQMLKSFVGRRFWRIALDLSTANAAGRNAHAGVQQSQIIVDFSLGGHGRSRIARGLLLPDSYGRCAARPFITLP